MTPAFIALAFIIGVLAGLGAAALQRRGKQSGEDLEALKEEFAAYREDVTTHFVQTADLINNLTQSYKAVYDHLERGAFDLVGAERLRRELEAVEAEPVMLEYLGKPGGRTSGRQGKEALGQNAKREPAAAPGTNGTTEQPVQGPEAAPKVPNETRVSPSAQGDGRGMSSGNEKVSSEVSEASSTHHSGDHPGPTPSPSPSLSPGEGDDLGHPDRG